MPAVVSDRRARRRVTAGAVAAALGLAACGGGSSPEARVTATAPAVTTTTVAQALDAKAVLAATRRSVAFVSAPDGSTGSGVLLPSGYVVTNAHVVQPFAELTVTFADGTVISRVPVKGVDAWTDMALLGPITTDQPPLPVDTGRALEQGDPVFLIGYPSETEARPVPTITSGILSRVREVDEFDITYLQTDATIAGGQSGGALVDDRGHLVGISGYSLDGFSLALRADDVQASVTAIAEGRGSEYRSLPTTPGATTGTLRLDEAHPVRFLYVPPSSRERTMTFELGEPGTPFQLFDLFDFTTYATNGLAEASYIAALPPEEQEQARADLGDVVSPDPSGTYAVTVPPDVYAMVAVGPFPGAPAARTVTYTSGVALVPVDGPPVRPVQLGDEVEGVLNNFDNEHAYTVDLQQGQRLPLRLVAPLGQLGLAVEGPGVDEAGDTPGSYADSVETPFEGSSAELSFVAPAAGRFTVYVFNNDYVLTGYRLSIG